MTSTEVPVTQQRYSEVPLYKRASSHEYINGSNVRKVQNTFASHTTHKPNMWTAMHINAEFDMLFPVLCFGIMPEVHETITAEMSVEQAPVR